MSLIWKKLLSLLEIGHEIGTAAKARSFVNPSANERGG
jgi:hypothetical protein